MFVVVLTFFLGVGNLETHTLKCHDMACVETVRAGLWDDPNLVRFRVFRAGDYAVLNGSVGATSFPPLSDEWHI